MDSLLLTAADLLITSVNNYKNIKEILDDAKSFFNRNKDSSNSIYINQYENFKITWPSQRWAIREIGNIIPSTVHISAPIQLNYILMTPKPLPNRFNPYAESYHNLTVTINRHGSIEMNTYVNTTISEITQLAKKLDAEFTEEVSSRKILQDHAVIVGKLVYTYKPLSDADGRKDISNPVEIDTIDYSTHLKFVKLLDPKIKCILLQEL
ncbi:MAG: hypothetical protein AB7U98_01305 [Candidatus Nitrosocosmicus sp.]